MEYAVLQGQSYDLGPDFASFQRTVDGTTDQIKKKFEDSINGKLKGKRIRARAARQYHNFEKDYEFDVSRISVEDYYDNFVVVAHDESGRKPKEYFLRPGAKIQVIGLASGHPMPTSTPSDPSPQLPKVNASPEEVGPTDRKNVPVREQNQAYDAYQIESIIDDIKPWARRLMKVPRIGERSFVKSLGWMKKLPDGRQKVVYDLVLPKENVKVELTDKHMTSILKSMSQTKGNVQTSFSLAGFKAERDSYHIRIAKYMRETGPKDTSSTKTFNVDEPENV